MPQEKLYISIVVSSTVQHLHNSISAKCLMLIRIVHLCCLCEGR